MFRFLSVVLGCLLCIGCSSNRAYNSFESLPKTHKLASYSGISCIDGSILATYFTQEAQNAVKDIQVIDGIMIQPFVVGVNIWSNLAGIITINGFGRKIVIDRLHFFKDGGYRTILHEYIHHLDSMDRQREGEWISHREFALAFHKALSDPKFTKELEEHLASARSFITDVFGIGPLSELIAYVGTWVAADNGPDYLRHVYRNIFKKCCGACDDKPPSLAGKTWLGAGNEDS